MTLLLVAVMMGSTLAILSTPSLGEDKPDLYLETKDIHFSDSEPEEGDEITIYATIHNGGSAAAEDILVTFKDHKPGRGDTEIIGNRTIERLGSREQTNVSIDWEADPAGNHTITVHIDLPEEIDESNEGNNAAEKKIVVKKKGEEKDTVLQGYTKRKDNGHHIKDVFIRVWKGNYSEETESDSEGWYEFELEEGGNYTVVAEKDGYERYEETVHITEGKTTTHHIRLTEDEGDVTEIVGYVYEKDSRGGDPIHHAEITIIGKTTNDSYTTYTNRDGYYEQELEAEDNYTVIAEAEGYESQTKHQYVEEGETEEVNFHLEKGSDEDTILKGYTKEKSNSTHIPDVDVILRKGDDAWNTTSNQDGYYQFDLEEGGKYVLMAEKEGYERFEVNITLEDGETTTYHIRMERESGEKETWIVGHVYEDRDRGGTPIEDAEVTITGNSCNCSYRVYTDDEGYYEQELPQEDNWTVTAEAEGYNSQTKHQYVEEGETEEVNFHLEKDEEKDTILKGYTKEKKNGSRIGHVSIRVSKGNFSETTKSDGSGYYEVELPEGGTYHIRTEKDGYKDLEANVTLDEGETKTYNIYLEKEGTNETWIEGYVTEADGRGGETPIEDAEITITLIKCQCGFKAYTDETGYYQRKLDEGGDYTVEAEALGYHTQKVNMTIEEAEYNYLDFHMERIKDKTVLKGFVRESGRGGGISDVEITLMKENFSETVYSNRDGYYEFRLDEGGTYSLTATKKGYKDYSIGNLTLEEEEETTHHIHMREDDEYTILHGHVIPDGDTERKVANAIVTVSKGNFTETMVTGQDGYYEFELPGAGQYHIRATKHTYQDYEAVETVFQGDEKVHTISLNSTHQEIFGHVREKDSMDPIKGATILVTGNTCNCSYTVSTDENGYYEVEIDLAGNYSVFASKDGYYSKMMETDVRENEGSRVEFLLEPEITKVHGYVREGGTRQSSGINDAKVHIQSAHESYNVYTIHSGYYDKILNKGGEFTLTVSKEGYVTQSKTVTINDGQEKRVDFNLEREAAGDEDRLYMRTEDRLESDDPEDGSYVWKRIEADFDDGPLPQTRSNRRWVTAGTWISEPTTQDITLEGPVTFNIWFREVDEGYDNLPEWRFILLYDNQSIAHVETGETASDPEDIIEITDTAHLSLTRQTDSITIAEGGVLSLSIEYLGFEDVNIYFGNASYDSGISVYADPGFSEKPGIENYGVAVTASKTKLDLEGKDVTVVTFTVKNIGELEDSYTLTISGTFKGWTATMDSPDTITLQPDEMKSISLTINESDSEDPEGDEIVVEVTAISQTYSEIQDSVRIKGTLEEGDTGIPDLTIPLIVASIGAGALVASFRRRY